MDEGYTESTWVEHLEDENQRLIDKCNLQAADLKQIKAYYASSLYAEQVRYKQLTDSKHKVKVLTDALWWAAERIDPIETKEYETDDDCHCPVCNALGPVKGE